ANGGIGATQVTIGPEAQRYRSGRGFELWPVAWNVAVLDRRVQSDHDRPEAACVLHRLLEAFLVRPSRHTGGNAVLDVYRLILDRLAALIFRCAEFAIRAGLDGSKPHRPAREPARPLRFVALGPGWNQSRADYDWALSQVYREIGSFG